MTRGTCPDLTFTRKILYADWVNTEETLGSGHYILNTTIGTRPLAKPTTQARLQHWPTFRQNYNTATTVHAQGYQSWSQELVSSLRSMKTSNYLSDAVSDVDNHLLPLWGAAQCLVRRWRRQKHNRKLKAAIAELTQQAAEYAAQLADANWVDRCNTAAWQMSSSNTRRLFCALNDQTRTRNGTQKHLQRAVHSFHGNTTQLERKLWDQYMRNTQNPRGPAYSYAGSEYVELD